MPKFSPVTLIESAPWPVLCWNLLKLYLGLLLEQPEQTGLGVWGQEGDEGIDHSGTMVKGAQNSIQGHLSGLLSRPRPRYPKKGWQWAGEWRSLFLKF